MAGPQRTKAASCLGSYNSSFLFSSLFPYLLPFFPSSPHQRISVVVISINLHFVDLLLQIPCALLVIFAPKNHRVTRPLGRIATVPAEVPPAWVEEKNLFWWSFYPTVSKILVFSSLFHHLPVEDALRQQEIKIMESLKSEKTSKTIQNSLMPPEDRTEHKRCSGVESQEICSPQGIPIVGLPPDGCSALCIRPSAQREPRRCGAPSQVSSQHRSPGHCLTEVTGDHPMWIFPWGMELEQRTKLFPHSGHSQGFPQ